MNYSGFTFPVFLVYFLFSCLCNFLNAQQFQSAQENFGGYVTWGTVWGDYNNDGYVDVYFSHGQDGYNWEGFLYKNNGDGTFTKITTAGDIVTEQYTSGGSSWGDYNNDGYLDMYIANVVTGSNYMPNSVHTNNTDGTFTKESTGSIGDIVVTQSTSSGAVAWLDYNNDGCLDGATNNGTYFGTGNNFLYENSGAPDYTFTEITNTFTNTGVSLRGALTFADFDEDGDIDIVIPSGNEFQNTRLYKNDGSPGFDFSIVNLTDSDTETQPVQSAAWGDIDNDADLDLYCANGALDGDGPVANLMFRNDNGSLVRITSGIGPIITDTDYSYTPAFADYDNDGDLDLFVGNDGGYDDGYRCRLYDNDGSGVFTSNTSTTLTIDNDFARSAAWADIDNDGDLDLMIGREGPNRLYINNGNSNNWLNIKFIGDGSTCNAHAIGSLVKVNATIGGSTYTQIRDISSQSNQGSHNSLRAHFGLGDATSVHSINVNWAGANTSNSYTDLPASKFMVFKQGDLNVTNDVIPNRNFMYLFGNTGGSVEFTSNTDSDGGTVTMQRSNSDPGSNGFNGSATAPDGSTVTPNIISSDRYWSVSESGLSGNFTATVYFDITGIGGVTDPDKLILVKRTSSSDPWTALNTERLGNTLYAASQTTFSEYAVASNSSDNSLPVELLTFEAEADDQRVTLKWITASELENLGFILQRSRRQPDNFETIASYKTHQDLKGRGNSSEETHYRFVDDNVYNGNIYFYKLIDVDFNGRQTVHNIVESMPNNMIESFRLFANYPNPFNPSTTIKYQLPARTSVDLTIYDLNGKLAARLLSAEQDAGEYEIKWTTNDVSSGIYICRLTTNQGVQSLKMILVR